MSNGDRGRRFRAQGAIAARGGGRGRCRLRRLRRAATAGSSLYLECGEEMLGAASSTSRRAAARSASCSTPPARSRLTGSPKRRRLREPLWPYRTRARLRGVWASRRRSRQNAAMVWKGRGPATYSPRICTAVSAQEPWLTDQLIRIASPRSGRGSEQGRPDAAQRRDRGPRPTTSRSARPLPTGASAPAGAGQARAGQPKR